MYIPYIHSLVLYTNTHLCTYLHTHGVHPHIHTHTRMHTRTRTPARAHTHTHTHTHTLQLIQQERIEQTRQRQQQHSQSGATPGPVDNTSFFHNLTPELRRTILADVDDSIINHLPEEIASEARALRQERETRRRQILEQRHAVLERIFEQANSGVDPGASLMAPPTWDASSPYRYAILNLNPQHLSAQHLAEAHHHLGRLGGLYHHPHHHLGAAGNSAGSGKAEPNSKQMLDQEALCCLLVLLFLDQNRLHNNRLHRIVKNLSQHAPTRAWIQSSLLTILHETGPILHPLGVSHTCPMPPPLQPRVGSEGTSKSAASTSGTSSSVHHHQLSMPHWLNLSINAALGSHARVFRFQQAGKLGTNAQISIHPLASVQVCNNVLDLLVFLSRQFPSSFLPSELMPSDKATPAGGSLPSTVLASRDAKEESNDVISNFWQILLRLDGVAGRKGKGSLKSFQFSESRKGCSSKELFSLSTIGHLIRLLEHSVLRVSISLTDKLLRVISVASSAIPRTGLSRKTAEPPPSTDTVAERGSKSSGLASRTGITEPGRASSQAATSDDVFTQEEEEVVDPSLLLVVIHVLTSGQCSEDGLEDATQLLTNLSKCNIKTRENILVMLLEGIRTIGLTLCSQIADLLHKLQTNWQALKLHRQFNLTEEQESAAPGTSQARVILPATSSPSLLTSNQIPGVILPGVPTEQPIIDHSKDLHLPSMVPLTCKGSQQSFFVRMLKVVCQLRESAHAALQLNQRTDGKWEGEKRLGELYIILCDCLCINRPFIAKCKFCVRPKITPRSVHDWYSINAVGVIIWHVGCSVLQGKALTLYRLSR